MCHAMTKPLITAMPESYSIKMAKDPVCGMTVNEETAKWKSEYEGNTYYFCNERCKTTFDKSPQRFMK